MSNSINKACPFTDEIVSYIYGEIGGQAELEFETHLADCMVCTDEFAEASNARYSVYEWKKEAFDPLPTPDIAVPYGEETVAGNYLAGLVAGIRAWAASLSVPITVAASLAILVGLGLVVFNYVGSTERSVANKAVSLDRAPEVVAPGPVDRIDTPKVMRPIPVAVKEPNPVRVPKRRSRNSPGPVRDFAIDRKTSPQVQKAPVLTAYQDSEDNSLRLADLFDEVGG